MTRVIRERLAADMDPLCRVLDELAHPTTGASADDRRAWLVGRDVGLAWVFDQAPVTVVPTGNVVGHVAVQRPAPASYDVPGRAVGDDVLEIVQLFVRPGPHQDGIARFLLKESVAHVRRLGATAVLDLRDNVSLTQRLVERRRFVPLGEPDRGVDRYVCPRS